MQDKPLLQELLLSESTPWQVHRCQLSQLNAAFDAPLPFLAQYDTLSDELKSAHPLSFEQLKNMDTPMTTADAAALIGVKDSDLKKAWQVKYVGKVVIFCETLQLALRLHFSNTSKPAHAVYLPSQADAINEQASQWRTFGVVDVLTRGQDVMSLDEAGDALEIVKDANYQALPSPHSLAITALINEHKDRLAWLDESIIEQVRASGIEAH